MRITQRQLRQIIKEELIRMSIRETDEYGYGTTQMSSIDANMKKPGVVGTFSSTTSLLQDGPYTWEIKIAPDFLDSLAQSTGESSSTFTLGSNDTEIASSVRDGIRVYLVKGPQDFMNKLGIVSADLPFDTINFVEDHAKFFNKLSKVAFSQGKTNLASNLSAVADAKSFSEYD